MTTTPLHLLKWRYRFSYPVVKMLLFGLLAAVPNSRMRASTVWHFNQLILILIVELCCALSFYAVQASDPGYITDAMMIRQDEDLDLDDTIASERLLDAQAEEETSQNDHKIAYSQKKIQRITLELSRINEQQTRTTTDSDDPDDLECGQRSTQPMPPIHSTFCSSCGLEPPLRSHHCRDCNQCVATFDHHCFCIGTCIGERNHGRFLTFIFIHSIQILIVLSTVCASFHVSDSISDWIHDNSIALAAMAIFGILAAFVLGLCAFHVFLMLGNLTTHEVYKGPDRIAYLQDTTECDLPFSEGLLRNMYGFCCVRASSRDVGPGWTPFRWKVPGRIVRDSEDICGHLWENKYYSCC